MTQPDDAEAFEAAREPGKLRLSLLENAYDSLNDSLENADLAQEHTRRWKLAIFLLVHSLELLMKERLRREHRLLVFGNVDKPGHTVSMEVALARLQTLGVGIDANDQHAIRTAIGWRDRIAHYEVELTIDDAQSIYALLFEFLHSFHRRELGEDLHAHISEQNWWKEAQLIELFRSEFVSYNGVDVIKTWPPTIAQGVVREVVDVPRRLTGRADLAPEVWSPGPRDRDEQAAEQTQYLRVGDTLAVGRAAERALVTGCPSAPSRSVIAGRDDERQEHDGQGARDRGRGDRAWRDPDRVGLHYAAPIARIQVPFLWREESCRPRPGAKRTRSCLILARIRVAQGRAGGRLLTATEQRSTSWRSGWHRGPRGVHGTHGLVSPRSLDPTKTVTCRDRNTSSATIS